MITENEYKLVCEWIHVALGGENVKWYTFGGCLRDLFKHGHIKNDIDVMIPSHALAMRVIKFFEKLGVLAQKSDSEYDDERHIVSIEIYIICREEPIKIDINWNHKHTNDFSCNLLCAHNGKLNKLFISNSYGSIKAYEMVFNHIRQSELHLVKFPTSAKHFIVLYMRHVKMQKKGYVMMDNIFCNVTSNLKLRLDCCGKETDILSIDDDDDPTCEQCQKKILKKNIHMKKKH